MRDDLRELLRGQLPPAIAVDPHRRVSRAVERRTIRRIEAVHLAGLEGDARARDDVLFLGMEARAGGKLRGHAGVELLCFAAAHAIDGDAGEIVGQEPIERAAIAGDDGGHPARAETQAVGLREERKGSAGCGRARRQQQGGRDEPAGASGEGTNRQG